MLAPDSAVQNKPVLCKEGIVPDLVLIGCDRNPVSDGHYGKRTVGQGVWFQRRLAVELAVQLLRGLPDGRVQLQDLRVHGVHVSTESSPRDQ